MSRPDGVRGSVAAAFVATVLIVGWLLWRDATRSSAPVGGDRTVAIVTAPPSVAGPPPPAPSLVERPPSPPPRATPPDAFVGTWRGQGDTRLAIARTGADRYHIQLFQGDVAETYDGLLQDGSIQLPRGIDGTWLQVADGRSGCLKLGAQDLFCRP